MEPTATPAESPADNAPPPAYRTLAIRFTGAGSEYFRIWIVNLLLLIVTFGIYWPWAKVRRLRYFMHNTLVDGDPLDFHGDPKQMLKGWALVGVLFAMYNVASSASALANLVGLCRTGGTLAGAVAIVAALSSGQHELARPALPFFRIGGGRLSGSLAQLSRGAAAGGAGAVGARGGGRGGARLGGAVLSLGPCCSFLCWRRGCSGA